MLNRLKRRPMQIKNRPILDSGFMGGFIVTSAPSIHDVVLPTSNLVLEPPGTPESSIPGGQADTPEESNTRAP